MSMTTTIGVTAQTKMISVHVDAKTKTAVQIFQSVDGQRRLSGAMSMTTTIGVTAQTQLTSNLAHKNEPRKSRTPLKHQKAKTIVISTS